MATLAIPAVRHSVSPSVGLSHSVSHTLATLLRAASCYVCVMFDAFGILIGCCLVLSGVLGHYIVSGEGLLRGIIR